MAAPFQQTKPSTQGEGRGQEFGARQNPYLPPGPKPNVFEVFNGINTNTTRPGVPDEQMWWCDGFIPLAQRNLRTLYGIGPVSYTASGTTVVFFDFVNIGSTPYMVVFLANGSVVAVNTTTLATTTILNAGTITAPSITTVGMSQWGNEYLIIVADQTNGYWLWNGAVSFTSGAVGPEVIVTAVGGGYGASPTLTVVGGSGSGASLVGSVSNGQLVSVSVVSGGSGYTAIDAISVVITPTPTGGSGGSIAVTGTIVSGTGAIQGVTIAAAGANYTTPTLTFTRILTGIPAQAVASVANGSIIAVSITNSGVYTSGGSLTTILPTVVITDAGVAATVSVHLMPFGIQGHAVETYSGHVWVVDGATLYYSAPGAVDDFSTSNGGGNSTSNSSTLKVQRTQLISANGFLYLVNDSSVDYISGVQTSGTPPTTTFTEQNVDPEVGSPYPQSVIPFGRNVLMANSYGVHRIAGGAVTKVSEMLDGVYNSVANLGGLQISSAQATMFGNRVWMVLLRLVDPLTLATVNKIAMWDGAEKWWFSGQEITLSYIKHQEINSVITAYGTNGTVVHPLFQQASGSLAKAVQTRLYDAPGGIVFNKSGVRAWAAAEYYSSVSTNMTLSIDNENAAGDVASYTITGPGTSVGNGSIFIAQPQAVGQQGRFQGLTIRTSAADMAIITAMLQEAIIEYRG